MKVRFENYEGEVAGCFCANGVPFFIVAVSDGTFRTVRVCYCAHTPERSEEPESPASYVSDYERLSEIIYSAVRRAENPKEAAMALLDGGYVSASTATTIARLFGLQKMEGKAALIQALKDGEMVGTVPQMREVKYKRWDSCGWKTAVRMSPIGHYEFYVPSLVAWLSSRYKLQVSRPEVVSAIENAKAMNVNAKAMNVQMIEP